jgi:two-component system, LytTR family, sensor kinase
MNETMRVAELAMEKPTLTRRAGQFLLIFGCWTIVSLISLTRHYMEEAGATETRPVWQVFLVWMTCYYSWALLTPSLFLVARRWPIAKGCWARNILIHVPISFAFTAVSILISHFLYCVVVQKPLANVTDYVESLHFTSFLKHFPLYWTTLAVANGLAYFRELQKKERLAAQLQLERSQLETSLRQAQLDALRMQLNPHFLFNTLQTISVLMMDDTASANRMLVRLSDLLRSTLRSSVDSLTPLRDEIAFLRAYLEIEQIRFADRLRVEWKLDSKTEHSLVPTLLLQPLVENSIRHGIARLATPGTITILSCIENGALRLSVADTGPGVSQGQGEEVGHGIGLSNTRKRLKQLYPEHEMEIIAGPLGGFEVRMSIPFVLERVDTTQEVVAR